MEARQQMKAGDFTKLAVMYSKYRPAYSETVLKAILGIINKPAHAIDFADVGAGTGIWTRMVAKLGCKSVTAIEPNDEMRKEGIVANNQLSINWLAGSAEKTGLQQNSIDLLSMASSFHWANFDLATQEFHRVLKPDGYFLIIWNPRYIENNPLLIDIENQITHLQPNIKRVSSGKSKHVDELAHRLSQCKLFTDIIHIEGMHQVELSKKEYIGVWNSVNDVRVQLGEDKFEQFIKYIDQVIQTPTISCSYQTRAWIVKKK